MQNRSESERPLRSIFGVLSDYTDELILIGGWVPYLQLTHGRAAVDAPRTSRTIEADLLLPVDMRRDARRPIAEILSDAGFARRSPPGVVWFREPQQGGEVIEFMQPLTGTVRDRGTPGMVADQPDLQARRLDHLGVMAEFTETVVVPANQEGGVLEIRLATLGAFVLNKANTFHARGGEDARPKAGKDLLYLRDIVAAGDHPVSVLEEDLDAIASTREHAEAVTRAAFHVERVALRYFDATAEILAEREGLDAAAARADVEGHLTDLGEILARRT